MISIPNQIWIWNLNHFFQKSQNNVLCCFLFLPATSRSDGIRVDPERNNFWKISYRKSIGVRLTLFKYWLISFFISVIDGERWLIHKGLIPSFIKHFSKMFLKNGTVKCIWYSCFYISIKNLNLSWLKW